MFKFGISLLFVIFSQIIFLTVIRVPFNIIRFLIFIIEISLVTWLISLGYGEEFKKKK